jgi:hypothetical protein
MTQFNWQSRPVFIPSTFRDLHAERDHLYNFVRNRKSVSSPA